MKQGENRREGAGLILDSADSIEGKARPTLKERRRWAAERRRWMEARKRERAAK